MEDTYSNIFRKLIGFAEECEKISAMVLFGSRARTEKKADAYSDYDIIFFVSDVNFFIETDEWLKEISEYYISFVERTAIQDYERRVFFSDARDMDFIFYNAKDARKITQHSIIKSWYSRGYQILVDKMEYYKLVDENKPFLLETNKVSSKEYENLVQTFWFHSIWATKKILRGEIWSGKSCIDGYMKSLLREMLEYQKKATNGCSYDVWHDGRFFDQWAEPEVLEELNDAYGNYDVTTLLAALRKTMALFSKEAKKTGERLHYTYSEQAEQYAIEQINKLVKEREKK